MRSFFDPEIFYHEWSRFKAWECFIFRVFIVVGNKAFSPPFMCQSLVFSPKPAHICKSTHHHRLLHVCFLSPDLRSESWAQRGRCWLTSVYACQKQVISTCEHRWAGWWMNELKVSTNPACHDCTVNFQYSDWQTHTPLTGQWGILLSRGQTSRWSHFKCPSPQ